MVNKIYTVSKINQLFSVDLNKNDIVIYPEQEINNKFPCKFIVFKGKIKNEVNLNNNLLRTMDELLSIMKGYNYTVEIMEGNFVLINYLILVADIMDLKVKYRGITIPSFKVGIDKEELEVFEHLLKEQINMDVYHTLPPQWKSLYYFINQDNIYLSKLGRLLIER